MERNRQSKIIAIVALCVAVVGLTLGFAAFSNTLKIDSSAAVTPSSSDFKLVLYGVPEIGEYDQYDAHEASFRDSMFTPTSIYTSPTTAEPILFHNYDVKEIESAKKAVITDKGNGALSITDISVTFTEPGQGAEYYFLLKNEGYYDAYFNVLNVPTPTATCTPGEGTTTSLVEAACGSINLTPYLGIPDENGEIDRYAENYVDERGNIKIPVGEYIYVSIRIGYNGTARADGPFSVTWYDLNFTLTTNQQ